MSRFKKYRGKDKYHIRFYRRNGNHPFIVVLVEEKQIDSNRFLLSGYMITHDIQKWFDYPNRYIRMHTNPNPKDQEPTFLCKIRLENISQRLFSKPYSNWHLSKEDEKIIDELENKKPSKRRH